MASNATDFNDVVTAEVGIGGLSVNTNGHGSFTSTVVGQVLVRKLAAADQLQKTRATFMTASRSTAKPWGVLPRFNITLGKLTIPVNAHVTEATNYEILLGSDFLHSAGGALIDFPQKSLWCMVSPGCYDFRKLQHDTYQKSSAVSSR